MSTPSPRRDPAAPLWAGPFVSTPSPRRDPAAPLWAGPFVSTPSPRRDPAAPLWAGLSCRLRRHAGTRLPHWSGPFVSTPSPRRDPAAPLWAGLSCRLRRHAGTRLPHSGQGLSCRLRRHAGTRLPHSGQAQLLPRFAVLHRDEVRLRGAENCPQTPLDRRTRVRDRHFRGLCAAQPVAVWPFNAGGSPSLHHNRGDAPAHLGPATRGVLPRIGG
ncbi:hypothetical protein SRABI26_03124 [Arthrobacter sp. Bi26]|nr:hypothetical protein SRABI26_03124 [Arthrobacter sp. Bi26]